MTPMTASQMQEVLHFRQAIKMFDSARSIPIDTWTVIEEALWLTPSSYNTQPWRFIVITDEELKDKLRAQAFKQPQVQDCSHLVVLCSLKEMNRSWIDRLMELTAKARGVSVDGLRGYGDLIAKDVLGERKDQVNEISVRHCFLALGQLMATATALGVDSCPIEGFRHDKFDEILELQATPWKTSLICALGYRDQRQAATILPRVRFPKDEIIEHR